MTLISFEMEQIEPINTVLAECVGMRNPLSLPLVLIAFVTLVLFNNVPGRKNATCESQCTFQQLYHCSAISLGWQNMERSILKWSSSVKANHPIFTLPVLNSRNYIVTDVKLAGLVQRNAMTLSFYSLITEVTRRLAAFDSDATRILCHNVNGEHGPGGLMSLVHDMMRRHLSPGPGLNAMLSVQHTQMATMLNAMGSRHSGSVNVNLYSWLRHIFSISNGLALYGPENVFALHPELEQAFWEFEDGMLGLLIDIFPFITARKAYTACRKLLNGLIEYVKKDRHERASPLSREHVQTNLDKGMTRDMIGRSEVLLMFGILGNSVPTNFWLTVNIFSRPELVQQIRCELESALDILPPTENPGVSTFRRTVVISSSTVADSCPLLYSCYKETLRDISLLTSAKWVLEDTAIQDYILRKNSVIQIAGGVIHHDEKVWGQDAKVFNPERFIQRVDSDRADDSSRHDKIDSTRVGVSLPKGVPFPAFRAFGGGNVICPGRHFAQAELMAMAAALVLAFDITEFDGSILRISEKDDTRIPLSVIKPVKDPEVSIKRRNGWEGVDLVIEL